MMAAGLLAVLPVVVLFFAIERQIVQGLAEDAAK
jgi:ABC-type glycerol-3-phosphate transport system permease component